MNSKIILLFTLASILFVSGCNTGTVRIGDTIYQDGVEIKFFSEECESLITDNDAFCEEKGMFGSLHRPQQGGKIEIYPNPSTVCYYYCVDEENYQKQASDESNFRIECTVPSDENPDDPHFSMTRYQSYGASDLDLRISYKLNTPIKVLSVVGKEDFSGEAVLDNMWQSRLGDEINIFKGIINTKPNQKITNGIIEITYIKDKVPQTFTSICKTTP